MSTASYHTREIETMEKHTASPRWPRAKSQANGDMALSIAADDTTQSNTQYKKTVLKALISLNQKTIFFRCIYHIQKKILSTLEAIEFRFWFWLNKSTSTVQKMK